MFLAGLGIALVIEGLALALGPRRFEDMVAALARMSPDARRLLGLAAVATGTALIWLAGP